MPPAITSVGDELQTPSVTSRGMDGTNSKSDRFYRPELDVLRFVAFLLVFVYHAMPATALPPTRYTGLKSLVKFVFAGLKNSTPFGLCLFFLLSSYLITELLQREQQRTNTIHIPSFYMRRILRIWPLYFGFVVAMAIVGRFSPAFRLGPGRVLAFALLAGNWYAAKYGYGAFTVVPLWSISVEEQFYLLWPSLARIGGNAGLMFLSAIIFPLSWFAIYRLTITHAVPDAIWVNSFVQFQYFAFGALLAVWMKGRVLKSNTFSRLALFGGGFLIWVAAEFAFQYHANNLTPRPVSTIVGFALAGVGCVLIFSSFLGAESLGKMKKLVYLGKISYGLYVFHYLCIIVSRAIVHSMDSRIFTKAQLSPAGPIYKLQGLAIIVLAFVLTVAMAAASYKYFERPFLKLKERFTFIPSRNA